MSAGTTSAEDPSAADASTGDPSTGTVSAGLMGDRGIRRGRPQGLPWPLAPAAAIAVAFLVLPLVALLTEVEWTRLPGLLIEPAALDALRLSLVCSTAATVLSAVLGVPLAWLLAHGTGRGMALLRGVVTLPLVLPPVVGGLALLLALGRRGLAGRGLDAWTGLTLPFSTAGVVVAETFVAMPFLVVTVEGALRSADAGLEEAAATLGATRLVVLAERELGVSQFRAGIGQFFR